MDLSQHAEGDLPPPLAMLDGPEMEYLLPLQYARLAVKTTPGVGASPHPTPLEATNEPRRRKRAPTERASTAQQRQRQRQQPGMGVSTSGDASAFSSLLSSKDPQFYFSMPDSMFTTEEDSKAKELLRTQPMQIVQAGLLGSMAKPSLEQLSLIKRQPEIAERILAEVNEKQYWERPLSIPMSFWGIGTRIWTQLIHALMCRDVAAMEFIFKRVLARSALSLPLAFLRLVTELYIIRLAESQQFGTLIDFLDEASRTTLRSSPPGFLEALQKAVSSGREQDSRNKFQDILANYLTILSRSPYEVPAKIIHLEMRYHLGFLKLEQLALTTRIERPLLPKMDLSIARLIAVARRQEVLGRITPHLSFPTLSSPDATITYRTIACGIPTHPHSEFYTMCMTATQIVRKTQGEAVERFKHVLKFVSGEVLSILSNAVRSVSQYDQESITHIMTYLEGTATTRQLARVREVRARVRDLAAECTRAVQERLAFKTKNITRFGASRFFASSSDHSMRKLIEAAFPSITQAQLDYFTLPAIPSGGVYHTVAQQFHEHAKEIRALNRSTRYTTTTSYRMHLKSSLLSFWAAEQFLLSAAQDIRLIGQQAPCGSLDGAVWASQAPPVAELDELEQKLLAKRGRIYACMASLIRGQSHEDSMSVGMGFHSPQLLGAHREDGSPLSSLVRDVELVQQFRDSSEFLSGDVHIPDTILTRVSLMLERPDLTAVQLLDELYRQLDNIEQVLREAHETKKEIIEGWNQFRTAHYELFVQEKTRATTRIGESLKRFVTCYYDSAASAIRAFRTQPTAFHMSAVILTRLATMYSTAGWPLLTLLDPAVYGSVNEQSQTSGPSLAGFTAGFRQDDTNEVDEPPSDRAADRAVPTEQVTASSQLDDSQSDVDTHGDDSVAALSSVPWARGLFGRSQGPDQHASEFDESGDLLDVGLPRFSFMPESEESEVDEDADGRRKAALQGFGLDTSLGEEEGEQASDTDDMQIHESPDSAKPTTAALGEESAEESEEFDLPWLKKPQFGKALAQLDVSDDDEEDQQEASKDGGGPIKSRDMETGDDVRPLVQASFISPSLAKQSFEWRADSVREVFRRSDQSQRTAIAAAASTPIQQLLKRQAESAREFRQRILAYLGFDGDDAEGSFHRMLVSGTMSSESFSRARTLMSEYEAERLRLLQEIRGAYIQFLSGTKRRAVRLSQHRLCRILTVQDEALKCARTHQVRSQTHRSGVQKAKSINRRISKSRAQSRALRSKSMALARHFLRQLKVGVRRCQRARRYWPNLKYYELDPFTGNVVIDPVSGLAIPRRGVILRLHLDALAAGPSNLLESSDQSDNLPLRLLSGVSRTALSRKQRLETWASNIFVPWEDTLGTGSKSESNDPFEVLGVTDTTWLRNKQAFDRWLRLRGFSISPKADDHYPLPPAPVPKSLLHRANCRSQQEFLDTLPVGDETSTSVVLRDAHRQYQTILERETAEGATAAVEAYDLPDCLNLLFSTKLYRQRKSLILHELKRNESAINRYHEAVSNLEGKQRISHAYSSILHLNPKYKEPLGFGLMPTMDGRSVARSESVTADAPTSAAEAAVMTNADPMLATALALTSTVPDFVQGTVASRVSDSEATTNAGGMTVVPVRWSRTQLRQAVRDGTIPATRAQPPRPLDATSKTVDSPSPTVFHFLPRFEGRADVSTAYRKPNEDSQAGVVVGDLGMEAVEERVARLLKASEPLNRLTPSEHSGLPTPPPHDDLDALLGSLVDRYLATTPQLVRSMNASAWGSSMNGGVAGTAPAVLVSLRKSVVSAMDVETGDRAPSKPNVDLRLIPTDFVRGLRASSSSNDPDDKEPRVSLYSALNYVDWSQASDISTTDLEQMVWLDARVFDYWLTVTRKYATVEVHEVEVPDEMETHKASTVKTSHYPFTTPRLLGATRPFLEARLRAPDADEVSTSANSGKVCRFRIPPSVAIRLLRQCSDFAYFPGSDKPSSLGEDKSAPQPISMIFTQDPPDGLLRPGLVRVGLVWSRDELQQKLGHRMTGSETLIDLPKFDVGPFSEDAPPTKSSLLTRMFLRYMDSGIDDKTNKTVSEAVSQDVKDAPQQALNSLPLFTAPAFDPLGFAAFVDLMKLRPRKKSKLVRKLRSFACSRLVLTSVLPSLSAFHASFEALRRVECDILKLRRIFGLSQLSGILKSTLATPEAISFLRSFARNPLLPPGPYAQLPRLSESTSMLLKGVEVPIVWTHPIRWHKGTFRMDQTLSRDFFEWVQDPWICYQHRVSATWSGYNSKLQPDLFRTIPPVLVYTAFAKVPRSQLLRVAELFESDMRNSLSPTEEVENVESVAVPSPLRTIDLIRSLQRRITISPARFIIRGTHVRFFSEAEKQVVNWARSHVQTYMQRLRSAPPTQHQKDRTERGAHPSLIGSASGDTDDFLLFDEYEESDPEQVERDFFRRSEVKEEGKTRSKRRRANAGPDDVETSEEDGIAESPDPSLSSIAPKQIRGQTKTRQGTSPTSAGPRSRARTNKRRMSLAEKAAAIRTIEDDESVVTSTMIDASKEPSPRATSLDSSGSDLSDAERAITVVKGLVLNSEVSEDDDDTRTVFPTELGASSLSRIRHTSKKSRMAHRSTAETDDEDDLHDQQLHDDDETTRKRARRFTRAATRAKTDAEPSFNDVLVISLPSDVGASSFARRTKPIRIDPADLLKSHLARLPWLRMSFKTMRGIDLVPPLEPTSHFLTKLLPALLPFDPSVVQSAAISNPYATITSKFYPRRVLSHIAPLLLLDRLLSNFSLNFGVYDPGSKHSLAVADVTGIYTKAIPYFASVSARRNLLLHAAKLQEIAEKFPTQENIEAAHRSLEEYRKRFGQQKADTLKSSLGKALAYGVDAELAERAMNILQRMREGTASSANVDDGKEEDEQKGDSSTQTQGAGGATQAGFSKGTDQETNALYNENFIRSARGPYSVRRSVESSKYPGPLLFSLYANLIWQLFLNVYPLPKQASAFLPQNDPVPGIERSELRPETHGVATSANSSLEQISLRPPPEWVLAGMTALWLKLFELDNTSFEAVFRLHQLASYTSRPGPRHAVIPRATACAAQEKSQFPRSAPSNTVFVCPDLGCARFLAQAPRWRLVDVVESITHDASCSQRRHVACLCAKARPFVTSANSDGHLAPTQGRNHPRARQSYAAVHGYPCEADLLALKPPSQMSTEAWRRTKLVVAQAVQYVQAEASSHGTILDAPWPTDVPLLAPVNNSPHDYFVFHHPFPPAPHLHDERFPYPSSITTSIQENKIVQAQSARPVPLRFLFALLLSEVCAKYLDAATSIMASSGPNQVSPSQGSGSGFTMTGAGATTGGTTGSPFASCVPNQISLTPSVLAARDEALLEEFRRFASDHTLMPPTTQTGRVAFVWHWAATWLARLARFAPPTVSRAVIAETSSIKHEQAERNHASRANSRIDVASGRNAMMVDEDSSHGSAMEVSSSARPTGPTVSGTEVSDEKVVQREDASLCTSLSGSLESPYHGVAVVRRYLTNASASAATHSVVLHANQADTQQFDSLSVWERRAWEAEKMRQERNRSMGTFDSTDESEGNAESAFTPNGMKLTPALRMLQRVKRRAAQDQKLALARQQALESAGASNLEELFARAYGGLLPKALQDAYRARLQSTRPIEQCQASLSEPSYDPSNITSTSAEDSSNGSIRLDPNSSLCRMLQYVLPIVGVEIGGDPVPSFVSPRFNNRATQYAYAKFQRAHMQFEKFFCHFIPRLLPLGSRKLIAASGLRMAESLNRMIRGIFLRNLRVFGRYVERTQAYYKDAAIRDLCVSSGLIHPRSMVQVLLPAPGTQEGKALLSAIRNVFACDESSMSQTVEEFRAYLSPPSEQTATVDEMRELGLPGDLPSSRLKTRLRRQLTWLVKELENTSSDDEFGADCEDEEVLEGSNMNQEEYTKHLQDVYSRAFAMRIVDRDDRKALLLRSFERAKVINEAKVTYRKRCMPSSTHQVVSNISGALRSQSDNEDMLRKSFVQSLISDVRRLENPALSDSQEHKQDEKYNASFYEAASAAMSLRDVARASQLWKHIKRPPSAAHVASILASQKRSLSSLMRDAASVAGSADNVFTCGVEWLSPASWKARLDDIDNEASGWLADCEMEFTRRFHRKAVVSLAENLTIKPKITGGQPRTLQEQELLAQYRHERMVYQHAVSNEMADNYQPLEKLWERVQQKDQFLPSSIYVGGRRQGRFVDSDHADVAWIAGTDSEISDPDTDLDESVENQYLFGESSVVQSDEQPSSHLATRSMVASYMSRTRGSTTVTGGSRRVPSLANIWFIRRREKQRIYLNSILRGFTSTNKDALQALAGRLLLLREQSAQCEPATLQKQCLPEALRAENDVRPSASQPQREHSAETSTPNVSPIILQATVKGNDLDLEDLATLGLGRKRTRSSRKQRPQRDDNAEEVASLAQALAIASRDSSRYVDDLGMATDPDGTESEDATRSAVSSHHETLSQAPEIPAPISQLQARRMASKDHTRWKHWLEPHVVSDTQALTDPSMREAKALSLLRALLRSARRTAETRTDTLRCTQQAREQPAIYSNAPQFASEEKGDNLSRSRSTNSPWQTVKKSKAQVSQSDSSEDESASLTSTPSDLYDLHELGHSSLLEQPEVRQSAALQMPGRTPFSRLPESRSASTGMQPSKLMDDTMLQALSTRLYSEKEKVYLRVRSSDSSVYLFERIVDGEANAKAVSAVDKVPGQTTEQSDKILEDTKSILFTQANLPADSNHNAGEPDAAPSIGCNSCETESSSLPSRFVLCACFRRRWIARLGWWRRSVPHLRGILPLPPPLPGYMGLASDSTPPPAMSESQIAAALLNLPNLGKVVLPLEIAKRLNLPHRLLEGELDGYALCYPPEAQGLDPNFRAKVLSWLNSEGLAPPAPPQTFESHFPDWSAVTSSIAATRMDRAAVVSPEAFLRHWRRVVLTAVLWIARLSPLVYRHSVLPLGANVDGPLGGGPASDVVIGTRLETPDLSNLTKMTFAFQSQMDYEAMRQFTANRMNELTQRALHPRHPHRIVKFPPSLLEHSALVRMESQRLGRTLTRFEMERLLWASQVSGATSKYQINRARDGTCAAVARTGIPGSTAYPFIPALESQRILQRLLADRGVHQFNSAHYKSMAAELENILRTASTRATRQSDRSDVPAPIDRNARTTLREIEEDEDPGLGRKRRRMKEAFRDPQLTTPATSGLNITSLSGPGTTESASVSTSAGARKRTRRS